MFVKGIDLITKTNDGWIGCDLDERSKRGLRAKAALKINPHWRERVRAGRVDLEEMRDLASRELAIAAQAVSGTRLFGPDTAPDSSLKFWRLYKMFGRRIGLPYSSCSPEHIYTGETSRPVEERIRQHRSEKKNPPWEHTIDYWTVDPRIFATHDEVLAAELISIRLEKPKYNKAGQDKALLEQTLFA